jgi:hypothetical protein
MGLFRRRRVEDDLLLLVRNELDSIRAEMQATLGETAAVLSGRVRSEIEHRMGEPHALAAGLQSVRNTIGARDAQLSQVLSRITETCETLSQRVELDRSERIALTEAVERLTTAVSAAETYVLTPASNGVSTVVGGTVDPAVDPDPAAGGDLSLPRGTTEIRPSVDIDLAATEAEAAGEGATRAATESETGPPRRPRAGRPARPDGVEVRCRFGDRWVSGFEVCEVLRLDDTTTRYRLRRRSDGSVIPTLFDEKDLRFFTTTFVEPR